MLSPCLIRIIGLQVPTHCPDVPDEVLQPREIWSDPEAYERQAHDLAERLRTSRSSLSRSRRRSEMPGRIQY